MTNITLDNGQQISLYTPIELKAHLDKFIIGQENAKRSISVAIYNHYKRLLINSSATEETKIAKSNILMAGPTGCGKTAIIKCIADYMGVPYYIGDATSLTQAGYVGDDVECLLSGLLRKCNYNIPLAQTGIIFIDEVDKLAKRESGPSIARDVGGEGVQQALLKIVEGSEVGVPPQEGRKHPDQPLIYVNTSNILFVGAGAFADIEEIIADRVEPTTKIGYSSKSKFEEDVETNDLYSLISQEDLREYGLIPEFIGRFPIITSVKNLEVEDLVKIITEPEDNILSQYERMFAFDDITFNIEDAAIEYIAKIAKALETGARALRSIFESILEDYMFELPGSDVKEFTVTLEDVKTRLGKRYKTIEINE